MSLFRSEIKISFFYTILIMLLFVASNYFTIKAIIDKELFLTKSSLMQFTEEVEKSIYSSEVKLPRSVKFRFAIYTQNHNLIFSNLEKKLTNFDFETYTKYPFMYYQKNIHPNEYEAAYIISSVKVNYSGIYMIATLLLLIVLAIIYSFSRLMIINTTIPYKKMQKYMDDFFNDSMHELKTPLGVININIELLKKLSQNSKYLVRIQAASKQMQITYDDIEYYIKNKNIKYSKEIINFSEFLESRISFFEETAMSKSLIINKNIEDNIEIFLNKTELQRLIDNTISNAIKYSHFKGEIKITLIRKNLDICSLIIEDFGVGIEDTKTVFNRFKREDTAQGGFGLGLNIVQNICVKNGIKVKISSQKNVGTTFTYEMSLHKIKFLDEV